MPEHSITLIVVGILCMRMSNLTKTPLAWFFFLVGMWFILAGFYDKVIR